MIEPLRWLIAIAAVVASAYQLIAIAAAFRQWKRRKQPLTRVPRVAILKPVRGADEDTRQAIESHFAIDYPDFELRFGFSDPTDGSREMVAGIAARYPNVTAILLNSTTESLNRKVGVLVDLSLDLKAEVVVVNDADISVPADYLHHLVPFLEEPEAGLVTCLYRSRFHGLAAKLEALSIATEFATGAMVAPLFGVKEFALGSTMAVRRSDLVGLGGFAVLKDYLADDYQLGKLIAQSGKRNVFASLVVTTALDGDWRAVWMHQLRWMRTIRLSRFDGYLGIPVMHGGLWALLAILFGWTTLGLAALAIRIAMACFAGGIVLGARHILWGDWLLVPARDILGFALWIGGFLGREVVWRGRRLFLAPDGRIVAVR